MVIEKNIPDKNDKKIIIHQVFFIGVNGIRKEINCEEIWNISELYIGKRGQNRYISIQK